VARIQTYRNTNAKPEHKAEMSEKSENRMRYSTAIYGTALGIDPEPELGLRSDLNSLIGSLLSIFKNKKHQKM